MAELRGIDKVVPPVCLADAACLKESVALKAGAFGGLGAGHDGDGVGHDGAHVGGQPHHPRAGAPGHQRRAKARVQPRAVPLGQHTGVELVLVARAGAQRRAVGVGHIAVVFIRPGGGVADSHRDHRGVVQSVVEVVPPIRAFGHIGGVQALAAVGVARVLGAAVEHPLIPPVGQVGDRGAPAHIVVGTEVVAARAVVAAKDIDAPVEHMGFAVGHIFPQWQIGVGGGMFHQRFLLVMAMRRAGQIRPPARCRCMCRCPRHGGCRRAGRSRRRRCRGWWRSG